MKNKELMETKVLLAKDLYLKEEEQGRLERFYRFVKAFDIDSRDFQQADTIIKMSYLFCNNLLETIYSNIENSIMKTNEAGLLSKMCVKGCEYLSPSIDIRDMNMAFVIGRLNNELADDKVDINKWRKIILEKQTFGMCYLIFSKYNNNIGRELIDRIYEIYCRYNDFADRYIELHRSILSGDSHLILEIYERDMFGLPLNEYRYSMHYFRDNVYINSDRESSIALLLSKDKLNNTPITFIKTFKTLRSLLGRKLEMAFNKIEYTQTGTINKKETIGKYLDSIFESFADIEMDMDHIELFDEIDNMMDIIKSKPFLKVITLLQALKSLDYKNIQGLEEFDGEFKRLINLLFYLIEVTANVTIGHIIILDKVNTSDLSQILYLDKEFNNASIYGKIIFKSVKDSFELDYSEYLSDMIK